MGFWKLRTLALAWKLRFILKALTLPGWEQVAEEQVKDTFLALWLKTNFPTPPQRTLLWNNDSLIISSYLRRVNWDVHVSPWPWAVSGSGWLVTGVTPSVISTWRRWQECVWAPPELRTRPRSRPPAHLLGPSHPRAAVYQARPNWFPLFIFTSLILLLSVRERHAGSSLSHFEKLYSCTWSS